jgi:L-fucono-1,5-lactonase
MMSSSSGVVDSHVHLWDPTVGDARWLDEADHRLNRAFTEEDLRSACPQSSNVSAVLITANASVDETSWFLQRLQDSSLFVGVVGWVDLLAPDLDDQLALLLDGPGGLKLKGIRHAVTTESNPDWLLRPEVIQGLGQLQRHGLTFDLLVRGDQLDAAERCAQLVEGLSFVLDHAGNPPEPGNARDAWSRSLTDLAGVDNVSVKLSSLEDRSAADLGRIAEQVLNTFGLGRVMIGSDWPLSALEHSYAEVLDGYHAVLSELSVTERDTVVCRNAVDFYGLVLA